MLKPEGPLQLMFAFSTLESSLGFLSRWYLFLIQVINFNDYWPRKQKPVQIELEKRTEDKEDVSAYAQKVLKDLGK